MRNSICTIIISVLAANIWSTASADEILNGGFESTGSGGITDAAEWAVNYQGGVLARSVTNPRSGIASMHFSTNIQGAAFALSQSPTTITGQAPSLAPGDQVYFEYYLDGTNIGTANFVAELTLTDEGSSWTASSGPLFSPNDDHVLGTYLATDSSSSLLTVPGNVVGPVTYSLNFSYLQGQSNGVQTEVFIDDVKLIVHSIPEPAMTCSLGLLGFVLGARRRKRL